MTRVSYRHQFALGAASVYNMAHRTVITWTVGRETLTLTLYNTGPGEFRLSKLTTWAEVKSLALHGRLSGAQFALTGSDSITERFDIPTNCSMYELALRLLHFKRQAAHRFVTL